MQNLGMVWSVWWKKVKHPNACSRDLCFLIAQNDVIEWSMSDIHNPSLSIPWLFPCVFLLETLVCQKKNLAGLV